MNREQWAKLSDQEKRVKIAELCGWKHDVISNSPWQMLPPRWVKGDVVSCPDYLNDLNAMHDAEDCRFDGTSGWRTEDAYLMNLSEVCGYPVDVRDDVPAIAIYAATAANRAEALAITCCLKE